MALECLPQTRKPIENWKWAVPVRDNKVRVGKILFSIQKKWRKLCLEFLFNSSKIPHLQTNVRWSQVKLEDKVWFFVRVGCRKSHMTKINTKHQLAWVSFNWQPTVPDSVKSKHQPDLQLWNAKPDGSNEFWKKPTFLSFNSWSFLCIPLQQADEELKS